MIKVKTIKTKKYCSVCEKSAIHQIWLHDDRLIQPCAAACLCKQCMKELKSILDKIVK